MSLWKDLDGKDNILDIEYERIVKDKDNYIQKIWEFCQLKEIIQKKKGKTCWNYS